MAPELPAGGEDPADARYDTSRVYVGGAWAQAAVYDRSRLRAGNVVTGPAIVTEMDSTTLVLPGHAGTVDAVGTILIRPI